MIYYALFKEVIVLGVTSPPLGNGRGLLPWVISSLIYLFHLWFVQVTFSVYWDVVSGAITLGEKSSSNAADVGFLQLVISPLTLVEVWRSASKLLGN